MWNRRICIVYDKPTHSWITSSTRHEGHGLTLISVWISNCIHHKVWEEISIFPNCNDCTVEVWEWISNPSHTLLGMWQLILVCQFSPLTHDCINININHMVPAAVCRKLHYFFIIYLPLSHISTTIANSRCVCFLLISFVSMLVMGQYRW